MTTIKNASPATVSIDMTADTARHMLRGSAPLVAHFDSLTAKAEALDALVAAAAEALRQLETPYIVEQVYRENACIALADALHAAKIAGQS